MQKGILIALALVPSLAMAKPKKPAKKKAGPAAAETDKAEPEPASSEAGSGSATPTVGSPAGPAAGTPTGTGTGATAGNGTGTSGPAPTPVVDKAEDKSEKADKEPAVDALRQEYLSLRDELFKSRARAAAVAGQLYSTKITIKLTWGSARYYGVSKATIRLDGATVYDNASGAIAGDDGVRFEGYVAPGKHLVTFHVEATGKDDDSFTSATESQVVVKAVANKDLLVAAKGRDNGDIAYEWKKSEHGSYGLGLDVAVKTIATGAKK